MKKNTIISMIVICYALFFEVGYVHSLGFSMEDFKSVVRARIEATGGRDTWHYRVFNKDPVTGKYGSCVDASRDRGKDIATAIKSMQYYGRFGLLGARVGTMSGYNALSIVPEAIRKEYIGTIGAGSMHTYNVVEIYDANGKSYYMVEVDNYLKPIFISAHENRSVNWDADNTWLIEDIPPIIKSVQVSNRPSATICDMVEFRVYADAAPWVKKNLKYKWMYVGGTKILGTGDTLRFRADYPYTYNLKAIIYQDTTGEEVDFAEAIGTMTVQQTSPPRSSCDTGRAYTGRKYTSPHAQSSRPSVSSPQQPADKVKDALDVFKKAGGFFGK
ncbi:MAG: hypothetical protein NTX75_06640 [Proteobacteria bacterium]|nr:hypothetical protein [Pseudomonadota bacterium]